MQSTKLQTYLVIDDNPSHEALVKAVKRELLADTRIGRNLGRAGLEAVCHLRIVVRGFVVFLEMLANSP